MTNLELKLKLAKELLELIEARSVLSGKGGYIFFWLDTGKEVTEREWDWVVWKCEESLSQEQSLQMIKVLRTMFYVTTKFLHPTWQQKAKAYFKVKGD